MTIEQQGGRHFVLPKRWIVRMDCRRAAGELLVGTGKKQVLLSRASLERRQHRCRLR